VGPKFTNFFQNEEQFQEFSSYETDHQIEVEMTPEEDNQQIPNIQMAQMHLNTNSNGENEMGSSGSENDESDEYRTPASTVKKSRGRPKFLRTGKQGRPRKLFHMVEEENNQTDITEETNKKHENMANLAEINDPSTVSEALSSENSKEWKAALQAEYDALTKNKTWSIVDCPNNKEIIGCRWILRTKYNADGTVERRKARLVAKGYDQKPGIDFEETFAPVARMESVRLLMAISVESGLELFQLDFVSAYLNGDIEEQIFMSIPQEFYMLATEEEKNDFKGNKVCLIKKALYGLKQSGRQWYKKLDEKLKILGMKPLDSDPCVYVHKIETNMLIVLIYVDDLIVATNNQTLLQRLKHELSTSFEMKDLGRLKYCLGVEFEQSEDLTQIRMKQNKYTKDILKRFNMADSKGAKTPLDPSEKLSKEMCPKTQEEKLEMERIPYQNLIGSLMYLAVSTRPDIAHAVSMLSQFNTNFGQQHWTAAKRVLRYLKHTTECGLVYRKTGEDIQGFLDADWGASIDDRRSYTGYVFCMARAAVSWESRKQRSVALSSTEAEYMALSECAKEAVLLRRFMDEVFNRKEEITIFNDNQGAGMLSKNPVYHNRTKHVDIRYHFVRDAVLNGEVVVKYMRTEEMPADVLTKGLSPLKHNMCSIKMGVM